MKTYTLDTNCIIALEQGDTEASHIRALVDACKAGIVDVAVVAMMASERQRGGKEITNFQQFQDRLDALGAGHLGHVLPLAYWDIAFWDKGIWGDSDLEALEAAIHDVLYPDRTFQLSQPHTEKELDVWLNAKCDVLAMWSHIHARRDTFVTSDRNFHKFTKKPKLVGLGAGQILRPQEAREAIDLERLLRPA